MIKRKYLAAGSVIVIMFLTLGVEVSGAEKSFKEASGDAARASVNYPANLVNESVNTVGKAVKGTADAVAETGKAVGRTLTGDVRSAPEVVTAPLAGSAETVKDATIDTLKTPVRAGEKTAEQSR